MCLISVIPKGKEKFNDKVIAFIKQGFRSNRDGSGYMFKRNGENLVHISKGFFDVDNLLKSIEDRKLTIDDELVIHHRIGTSGLNNRTNTHPFVLSKLHNECCAIELAVAKPCLAHNGIFSGLNYYMGLDRDFSDTYAFSRYILSNKHLQNILLEDEKLFETITSDIVGYSRLAILYPDRDLKLVGNFVEDDGYLHSNSGYKSFIRDYGGSSDNNHQKTEAYYRSLFSEGYGEEGNLDYERDNKEEAEDNTIAVSAICSLDNNSNHNWGKSLVNHLNEKDQRILEQGNKVLKLDSSFVKITIKNFNHFYYINKKVYDGFLNKDNLVLKELKEFTPKTEFQSLNSREPSDGNSTIYNVFTTVRTDKMDLLYYIPKKEYRQPYAELLFLVTSVPKPGKQTLKKIELIVSKNINKRNDTLIDYKRFNKSFSKQSFVLFRDYLRDKLETKQAPLILEG